MDLPVVSLIKVYVQAFKFLEKVVEDTSMLEQNVMIHCMAGKSRSVSITIAYFMIKFNLTFVEAYKYVKAKRPVANPNEGFMEQLCNFEKVVEIYHCYIKSDIYKNNFSEKIEDADIFRGILAQKLQFDILEDLIKTHLGVYLKPHSEMLMDLKKKTKRTENYNKINDEIKSTRKK